MKKKELTRFVRFGGLNLKKSKGFKENSDGYHSPPAPKGFYAMPLIAQEFFLISSIEKYQPDNIPKTKNIDFSIDINYDNYEKSRKLALTKIRKEFLKNEGTIWHHLIEYTPHHKVLDTHGSWIKTDIKDWELAFNTMSVALKAESIKFNRSDSDKYGIGINNIRGITGFFSKDHCEVFFDEKV